MGRAPEPVDVIAHHDQSGKIYPLTFIRSGSAYKVRDVGRRWNDDAGEHILVMIDKDEVCELLHDADGRWFLLPRPGAAFA
jgi:hypothetical protein